MESSPRDAPDTRQTILRVAQQLFREQGFRAVSTRQIAAACQLTQPALYRHFATKQDLYVEVLLDDLQRLHAQLLAIVAHEGDVIQRLREVTHILPVTWEDASQMFHDIAHELDDARRDLVAAQFAHDVVAPIAALFALGVSQGLLRSVDQGGLDATEATFVLFRLLDEHEPAYSRHSSPLAHAEQMLDVLLHGLLQPPQANR